MVIRKIFFSYSNYDDDNRGKRIAQAVRNRIHERHALASFFDIYDIPPGVRFNEVLIQQVRTSAFVAIYTDSYSSREWCRREVIEAKLSNVPFIIANCITDMDERSFPYMGNVPVIRLEDPDNERIDYLIYRLLDEVLKDFLWRCQIESYHPLIDSCITFLPRLPELISIARASNESDKTASQIVYPDPPIGDEEARLFNVIAPHVKLQSMMEWIAEKIP